MKAPSTNSSSFEIPEGTYPAICIHIIDCGVWEREYQGNTKQKPEIYLRWMLPTVIIPDGDYQGECAEIGKRYSFSMYKKSNLRRDLETWRGKPFTDIEAAGFDIDNVLQIPCMLSVFTNDKGYTNIHMITPYQGEKIEVPDSKILLFDTGNPEGFDSLPKWIQRKINVQEMSHET